MICRSYELKYLMNWSAHVYTNMIHFPTVQYPVCSVYCAASVASCLLGFVNLESMDATVLSTLMSMIGGVALW